MNTLELRLDAPEVEGCHVSSLDELNALMSNLHDCSFDLDEAVFDQAERTWSAAFLRPLWEAPGMECERRKALLGRFLDVKKYRVPVARAVIRVRGVMQAQLIDDQGIQHYYFNEVSATDDGVRFDFCEALKIALHLTGGIDATYVEESMPGIRAVYSQFLSVQSGPKIVEVPESN